MTVGKFTVWFLRDNGDWGYYPVNTTVWAAKALASDLMDQEDTIQRVEVVNEDKERVWVLHRVEEAA